VRKHLKAVVAVVACLAASGVAPLVPLADRAEPAAADPVKPNVVVLMMDDMTLQELPFMPNVNALLKDQGTSFSNFYVSTPECCPSRATFLTGQYMHNHNVKSGIRPTGGYYKMDHTKALPVWLSNAGYYTAHVGKYLNDLGKVNPLDRPPGWSDYYGLYEPTNYNYFNYDVNNNGVAEHHGTADADYQTDVLGQRAVDVINGQAASTQPLFLYFAPLPPHSGTKAGTGIKYPVQPPRYKGVMGTTPQPLTPDFNEADVSDKPSFMQALPALDATSVHNMENWWRQSVEGLLAADEWIGKIVDALNASGKLANTDIIFTSDNGFMHGEHRVKVEKLWPYQVDIKMPLIIRGPGWPAGQVIEQRAINPDITATILDITGSTALATRTRDGMTLVPMITNTLYGSNRSLLLELGPAGTRITYTGIMGPRWKYIEYSNGEKELYDVINDPYELTNRAADQSVAWIRVALANRLATLRTCAGSTCRS
jgi:arylsulfatase A-like enzyme